MSFGLSRGSFLTIATLVAFLRGHLIFASGLEADPATGMPVALLEVPVDSTSADVALALEDQAKARQAALDLKLIEAIATRDVSAVKAALDSGAQANAEIPNPAPAGLAESYTGTPLHYYLKAESGFTVLMFACGLGETEIVETLLAAGANPVAKTRKNKTLPIQLAAKAGNTMIQQRLLGVTPDSPATHISVEVDLFNQMVFVRDRGTVLLTTPISSGRTSNPTPTGDFVVTDKWKSWTSTIYKVKMPNFLRLSCSEVGLHAGKLPGYPASHGCIRLPSDKSKEVYDLVPLGALVTVR